MRTWLLLGAAAMLLGACGGSLASSPPSGSQKSSVVLLDLSSGGVKNTRKFTATGDWDLQWSYDCSNFGAAGNFIVFVMNGDGSPSLENEGLNHLGMKRGDVLHYYKGGTYYLKITSECNWHVTAKGWIVASPAPGSSPVGTPGASAAPSPAGTPAASAAPSGR